MLHIKGRLAVVAILGTMLVSGNAMAHTTVLSKNTPTDYSSRDELEVRVDQCEHIRHGRGRDSGHDRESGGEVPTRRRGREDHSACRSQGGNHRNGPGPAERGGTAQRRRGLRCECSQTEGGRGEDGRVNLSVAPSTVSLATCRREERGGDVA